MVTALNFLVPFIVTAPAIRIIRGVAHIRERSGGLAFEKTMPVECLTKYVERYQDALRQHAAGEEIVIVED